MIKSTGHNYLLLFFIRVQPLLSVMAQKIVLFVHRCLARRCSNLFRDHFVPVNGHQTRGCCQQLLVVPVSGQVPMVERQSSSMVLSPGMPSQQPCVWKRILASFLPSSSACLRVPVSLNCHISSQLSNYRKVTLLLFKAQLLLSHITVIYLSYKI